MKKLALLCTLFLVGFLFTTEAQVNLLLNGDFEDTNYNTFTYESITNCPDQIPGWDMEDSIVAGDYNNVGLDKYNIRAVIGLNDSIENKQYLRIQRYEWDGWGDGGLQQTVSILPSRIYKLSFLYKLSSNSVNSTIVPAWFRIQEDDNAAVTKKLYNNLDEKWTTKSYTFTSSDSATSLLIYLGITGGKLYSWGGNIDFWAEFDNVELIETGVNALTTINDEEEPVSGYVNNNILFLQGLEQGPVEIYSIIGKRVRYFNACSDKAQLPFTEKGLFIVRNGTNRKPYKMWVN